MRYPSTGRRKYNDPERRRKPLFLDGAERFNEEHVQLFDEVLARLIVELESKFRIELSCQLAPVGNAPRNVALCLANLANDDNISVACPVLRESTRITEADLVDIARIKSQAHLLAISERHGIAELVTGVGGPRRAACGTKDLPRTGARGFPPRALLMGAERVDPVLILCKAAGWGWPTAKALITVRANGGGISSHSLA